MRSFPPDNLRRGFDEPDSANHARRDGSRPLHDLPRRVDRERSPALDPGRLPRRRIGAAVGRDGVQPGHGRGHHVRRDSRGSPRPETRLPVRDRALHGLLDRLRDGRIARRAECGARDPGRGRGDGERDVPRARERRLRRSEAEGMGDRHLDRDRLDRDGDRPDARRTARSAQRLACDLPRQRSRGRRGPRADVEVRGGVSRQPSPPLRSPWPGSLRRGGGRLRVRRDRGAARGVAIDRDRGALRRRARRAGCVRPRRELQRGSR